MERLIFYFGFLFMIFSCGSEKSNLEYSVNKLKLNQLKTVEDTFRKKHLDVIGKIKDNLAGDYQAYYIDERRSNDVSFVTVYVTRDAFSIIFLLVLKSGALVSYEELAGGICSGPNEENDVIYWCGESWTKFTGERNFYKIMVRKKSKDFVNSSLFIDTIKAYFSIQQDGTIKLLNTDSVRIEKQLDEHGKEK